MPSISQAKAPAYRQAGATTIVNFQKRKIIYAMRYALCSMRSLQGWVVSTVFGWRFPRHIEG